MVPKLLKGLKCMKEKWHRLQFICTWDKMIFFLIFVKLLALLLSNSLFTKQVWNVTRDSVFLTFIKNYSLKICLMTRYLDSWIKISKDNNFRFEKTVRKKSGVYLSLFFVSKNNSKNQMLLLLLLLLLLL